MTLADRLKSSLAAALMQNSPLAAVPVEDLREAVERLERLGVVVNQQAEDAGLWFVAEYAPEAYLQHALRRLHAMIEDEL